MPPEDPTSSRRVGYHLSSEEHDARRLVTLSRSAESSGFDFLQVSDHFHPWTNRQGESPFVWGVLGALSQATDEIPVGTAVTCPTMRLHPAIIAQAAATAASQLEGRFFFGVGSGERLNETVLGDRWPPVSVRLEMMEEAVRLIRDLWTGDMLTRHGNHYTVENARIFSLPQELPPIVVSAFGPEATEVAARIGDGIMSTDPDGDLVEQYRRQGGSGPAYSMTTVCVAPDEGEALRAAREWWPNAVIPGLAGQELSIPEHFEPIPEAIGDDAFRDTFVLGPDPEPHVERLSALFNAGYDHVAVHQVGDDQGDFFRLYGREVLPAVRATGSSEVRVAG